MYLYIKVLNEESPIFQTKQTAVGGVFKDILYFLLAAPFNPTEHALCRITTLSRHTCKFLKLLTGDNRF